jgi:hypothetical protein
MRRVSRGPAKLKENLDFRARFGHKRPAGVVRKDIESVPHFAPL